MAPYAAVRLRAAEKARSSLGLCDLRAECTALIAYDASLGSAAEAADDLEELCATDHIASACVWADARHTEAMRRLAAMQRRLYL
jgi:hypothetical protein